jgi:hypothetical protein
LLNYTLTEDKQGNTTIKIRMNNKLSALDKIAKHLKFYEAAHPAHDSAYWIMSEAAMEEDDRYDDDSFEKQETEQEAEINRRIAEAREQAIAETELRMKEAFKLKLKQVKKAAKEKLAAAVNTTSANGYSAHGTDADEKNTDKYPHIEKNHELRIKSREYNMIDDQIAKATEKALAEREEEIIEYRVGDYTPEGHLIMQAASSRDKRSSFYNPNGDFYYLRQTGPMLEKVYLPARKAVA